MSGPGVVVGAADSCNQHQHRRHSRRLMRTLVVLIGAEPDTRWKQLQPVERKVSAHLDLCTACDFFLSSFYSREGQRMCTEPPSFHFRRKDGELCFRLFFLFRVYTKRLGAIHGQYTLLIPVHLLENYPSPPSSVSPHLSH